MSEGRVTKRRWFRYSLRSLLVVVTAASVISAVLPSFVGWLRYRSRKLDVSSKFSSQRPFLKDAYFKEDIEE